MNAYIISQQDDQTNQRPLDLGRRGYRLPRSSTLLMRRLYRDTCLGKDDDHNGDLAMTAVFHKCLIVLSVSLWLCMTGCECTLVDKQAELDQCIKNISDANDDIESMVTPMKNIEYIPICEDANYWVRLANDANLSGNVRSLAADQLFIRFVPTPIGVRQLCERYNISNWFTNNTVFVLPGMSVSVFEMLSAWTFDISEIRFLWPNTSDLQLRGITFRMNKYTSEEHLIAVARGEEQDDQLLITAIHIPTPDVGVILKDGCVYRYDHESIVMGMPRLVKSTRVIPKPGR